MSLQLTLRSGLSFSRDVTAKMLPAAAELINFRSIGSIGEMRVQCERERERGEWRVEEKKRKRNSFSFLSLSFHSFILSLVLQNVQDPAARRRAKEPTINVTFPSTHLLTRSGKRPLTKEEEDEEFNGTPITFILSRVPCALLSPGAKQQGEQDVFVTFLSFFL